MEKAKKIVPEGWFKWERPGIDFPFYNDDSVPAWHAWLLIGVKRIASVPIRRIRRFSQANCLRPHSPGERLGNVFFRLRLIERFGTGVLSIREAYRGCERQPKFKVYENSICVTLPLASKGIPLSDDERKVYRELVGRSLQMSELTERTGFCRTKAQAITKALIENGFASVSGAGRGTRYSAAR